MGRPRAARRDGVARERNVSQSVVEHLISSLASCIELAVASINGRTVPLLNRRDGDGGQRSSGTSTRARRPECAAMQQHW